MEVVFQRVTTNTYLVLDNFVNEKLSPVFVADVKKQKRNPKFHSKVFAFFKFCFDHWKSEREFIDEHGQFEVFRKNLTVLAGYYNDYYTIKGDVRIEAKSLSYASMDDQEFKSCYNALINAAVRTIFKNCGKDIEEKLYSFF